MREYTINYLFNGEPRTHAFELNQPELRVHEAALHLLQLHFGDAENGLILPPADALPEQILEQAQVVGITQIEVA
ncbi:MULTISPECIES: hypothetical protein [Pseudomonas]|uniref:Uncharacterized protein n=1 Tax=Pseudomonas fluorescens TaxID=294 RepID=A0ACD4XMX0_PSEFL|nr:MULTISPECIES: hypothetical protein [Pseudomonas]MBZ6457344.1 hypothetical protein [Pseudomonas fluorescens group sp.]MBZ6462545.1 hypothetical protein [Pseudomonas fluorescens group sp.]MBZ6470940.1 hypothetical protein [Pseudomonas fluorescens group sp.]WQD70550.1 hypothetical protein U0037_21180 [Pseudomonas marginalis]SFU35265.1 hypothetical protein SAMN05428951_10181 [Pseudomonas sp. OV546]